MNSYKKNVFINLAILFIYVAYFYLLNYMFYNLTSEKFIEIYKYISLGMLFVSVIIFEIAYHKDKGVIAVFGIEILVLAINTLISINMVKRFNITFVKYINFSCADYIIYYIFKFVITYTKERKKYLESLSDIKEIVTSEPQKKEAKRKNTN